MNEDDFNNKFTPTPPTPTTAQRLGLPSDFTDEDLAYLPEIEVQSLREQGILDDLVDPDLDESDAEAAAAAAAAEAKAAPDADADAEKAKGDDGDLPEITITDVVPEFDPKKLRAVPDVGEANRKLEALSGELAAAQRKFNDADINDEDFNAEVDRITEARAELISVVKSAQRIEAENFQTYADSWHQAVDVYMTANEALKPGTDAHVAFDAALRDINGNSANQGLSFSGRLRMAHMRVAAIFPEAAVSKSSAAPKVEDADGDAAKKAQKAEGGPRKDPRPDPVPTLAAAPAAAVNSMTDGEFSSVDNAPTPLAAEAAYERMTAEQQARYLAGA